MLGLIELLNEGINSLDDAGEGLLSEANIEGGSELHICLHLLEQGFDHSGVVGYLRHAIRYYKYFGILGVI